MTAGRYSEAKCDNLFPFHAVLNMSRNILLFRCYWTEGNSCVYAGLHSNRKPH